MARFTKLHGSVDWVDCDGIIRRLGLPFGAKDFKPYLAAPMLKGADAMHLMVYPNAAKDRETASHPYVELFRDFAAAICRPNSTLVCYGYSFGDEHINRVIEDMLTIPSAHLVAISHGDPLGRIMAHIRETGQARPGHPFDWRPSRRFPDTRQVLPAEARDRPHYVPDGGVAESPLGWRPRRERRGRQVTRRSGRHGVMSQAPFEQAESLRIGTVDFVSPDEIKVALDIEAPESVALNAGSPRPFPRVNGYLLIPVDEGFLVGQVEWLTVERSAFPSGVGCRTLASWTSPIHCGG